MEKRFEWSIAFEFAVLYAEILLQAGAKNVGVFGSFARNKQAVGDIDFIVIVENEIADEWLRRNLTPMLNFSSSVDLAYLMVLHLLKASREVERKIDELRNKYQIPTHFILWPENPSEEFIATIRGQADLQKSQFLTNITIDFKKYGSGGFYPSVIPGYYNIFPNDRGMLKRLARLFFG